MNFENFFIKDRKNLKVIDIKDEEEYNNIYILYDHYINEDFIISDKDIEYEGRFDYGCSNKYWNYVLTRVYSVNNILKVKIFSFQKESHLVKKAYKTFGKYKIIGFPLFVKQFLEDEIEQYASKREYSIGKILNTLKEKNIYNFLHTVMLSKKTKFNYLIIENRDEDTLKRIIKSNKKKYWSDEKNKKVKNIYYKIDPKIIQDAITQIFFLLHSNPIKNIKFYHNDLHPGNIRLIKLDNTTYINYDIGNTRYKIESNYLVKISDFGESSVNVKNIQDEGNIQIGEKENDDFLFFLLSFLLEYSKHRNLQEIENYIQILELYFEDFDFVEYYNIIHDASQDITVEQYTKGKRIRNKDVYLKDINNKFKLSKTPTFKDIYDFLFIVMFNITDKKHNILCFDY